MKPQIVTPTLPKHVAIIMDGNGRWALERGKRRLEGHREGANVVRDITTYARELGIEHLTLYSFSIQNWCRPADEVAGLMQLLEEYCVDERDTLMDNEIRLATIGMEGRLPTSTQGALDKLMGETAGNDKMTLTLALDYGGREELVYAAKRIAQQVAAGELRPEDINESTVANNLYTAGVPDPDLVIRTSGELRVSNFLLWQIAYSEFYFCDLYWPDFERSNFDDALAALAGRDRRFGATQQQLDTKKLSG